MTEPAFLKPCPKVTNVSSIAVELKSSRGTFSSIAIELKIDGQRALKGLSHCHVLGYDIRRVNNSPHIVGKSKRYRLVLAVVVH